MNDSLGSHTYWGLVQMLLLTARLLVWSYHTTGLVASSISGLVSSSGKWIWKLRKLLFWNDFRLRGELSPQHQELLSSLSHLRESCHHGAKYGWNAINPNTSVCISHKRGQNLQYNHLNRIPLVSLILSKTSFWAQGISSELRVA